MFKLLGSLNPFLSPSLLGCNIGSFPITKQYDQQHKACIIGIHNDYILALQRAQAHGYPSEGKEPAYSKTTLSSDGKTRIRGSGFDED